MSAMISSGKSTSRLRLWEIDPCFRCPVIGACLSHSEQMSLLRKIGGSYENASPYEIHEALVSASGEENSLSRRVDTAIHRKYARGLAAYLALAPDALAERFRAVLRSEQMAAVLWAAAVRRDLGLEQKREIFGELHIAMHTSLGETPQFARRMERAEKEMEKLRLELKQATADRRTLQKEMDAHRQESMTSRNALASSERDKNQLLRELDALRQRDAEADTAAEELRGMEMAFADVRRQLDDATQYATALEEENATLYRQLAQTRESGPIRHPQEEAVASREFFDAAALPQCQKCDESCPVSDLCRKRILIIGGIERMESRYRKLIEESGGVMEYHDGHVNKGARELECRLKRADMVLCPVNCNSHAACLIIKKLGKKHGKPVCMLSNFSLSTVSRAIWNEDRSVSLN